MRWAIVALLLAGIAAAARADLPAAELGYRLQPGDVLQIAVWKEPELQGEALIRPDGGMTFPLAGELKAAGLTVSELRTQLEALIRPLIPDATVTVTVKALTGSRVYVIGKVARPGEVPLIQPTDVLQALSVAGGITPFADGNAIKILRRERGRQIAMPFHYADVARGRHLDQNVLLRSGDVVVVP